MGRLINIDNGGTQTDFCVLDDGNIFHTKTLTTPFDLSKCFFDGLQKIAKEIYGNDQSLNKLLQTTDYIRYSTTQGTNALVERKGPRLGLLIAKGSSVDALLSDNQETQLFTDLIQERIGEIDLSLSNDLVEMNIVKAVNKITTAGANRIVLSLDVADFKEKDTLISKTIGRKFPSHLLGVVPVIPASELADDNNYKRRTWTALMNAFLHPAMERFLYNADHRLKDFKTQNPLLIFRNDGGAARIAKTMAIKTYSSGPCAGLQGAKELAKHYQFPHLVTYDVGGTTTDIGVIKDGNIDEGLHGKVEGVDVSFSLPTIDSAGVGGSSIIAVTDGELTVGPQSVGSAPGPACFGLGGQQATITDVFLLLGVLNPESYFGGELELNIEKARDIIQTTIATPLGLSEFKALEKMRDAWVEKIASSIQDVTELDQSTTLAGFGGAGALAATRIADQLNVRRVIIPGLSAVFSAFGIGFSPISQHYRIRITNGDNEAFNALVTQTLKRAEKDLFAEGIALTECDINIKVVRTRGSEEQTFKVNNQATLPCDIAKQDEARLILTASKTIDSFSFQGHQQNETTDAISSENRSLLVAESDRRNVNVYSLKTLKPGDYAEGPAIIEEDYFTGFIDESWSITGTSNADLLLEKIQS